MRQNALSPEFIQQFWLQTQLLFHFRSRMSPIQQLYRVDQRAHIEEPSYSLVTRLIDSLHILIMLLLQLLPGLQHPQGHIIPARGKHGSGIERGRRIGMLHRSRRRGIGRVGLHDAHLVQTAGEFSRGEVWIYGVCFDGCWGLVVAIGGLGKLLSYLRLWTRHPLVRAWGAIGLRMGRVIWWEICAALREMLWRMRNPW